MKKPEKTGHTKEKKLPLVTAVLLIAVLSLGLWLVLIRLLRLALEEC